MRKPLLIVIAAALALPALAAAEVSVNIQVGVPAPPPVVVSPPPPVVVAGPPAVLFQSAPLFVTPPRLGFYVGVDVPYDIIFTANNYYLYYGNSWYRSPYYNGPWVVVRHDRLPPEVRRHRIDFIRANRDEEFHSYREHREHYRGRHFTPGREERRYEKEERKREKEEWKDEKRERKEHRHDRD